MGRPRDLLYRIAIFIPRHDAESGIPLHLGVLPGRDMVCVGLVAALYTRSRLSLRHGGHSSRMFLTNCAQVTPAALRPAKLSGEQEAPRVARVSKSAPPNITSLGRGKLISQLDSGNSAPAALKNRYFSNFT